MGIQIFAGMPPKKINDWIVEHYSPVPVGHAETWIKFSENDTWHEYDFKDALDKQAFVAAGLLDDGAEPYWITPLYAIEIGTDVTSIGWAAFADCRELTSVTIPASVTSIVDYAFYGCSGLTSVTIPDGVTSIGSSAFSYCSGLTSVTFLGKTLEQVQNIEDGNGNKYYPWDISDTSIINVA